MCGVCYIKFLTMGIYCWLLKITIRKCEVLGTLEWSIVHLIFAPVLMQTCVEGLCVGWECNMLLLGVVLFELPLLRLENPVLGYHSVLFVRLFGFKQGEKQKTAHCAKCRVFKCCSSIFAFLRNCVDESTLWK